MNSILRLVGKDTGKGVYEYTSGTTAAGFGLLCNLCAAYAGNNDWMTGLIRVYHASTADALNAISINTTTGQLYIGNILACSWLPAKWGFFWTPDATRTYFAGNVTHTYWRGIAAPNTISSTGATVGQVYSDYNQDRSAINALSATINVAIYVGFWRK